MAHISIKDVPESWAACLRDRAARNHRSLQGELMAIIEQAVIGSGVPAQASPQAAASSQAGVVGYGAGGQPIIRQGYKTVEQIAAELKAKYPKPLQGAPLGVDIIRHERDSR